MNKSDFDNLRVGNGMEAFVYGKWRKIKGCDWFKDELKVVNESGAQVWVSYEKIEKVRSHD